MNIPRSEHPNPQKMRKDWLNLNGIWQFEIDKSASGKQRGYAQKKELAGSILVPFCPESKLSGVTETDFLNGVWYLREFSVPKNWLENGRRVFLHFGACDFKTDVYINGNHAGMHIGGYASFSFDITDHLTDGVNTLTVSAEDDVRNPMQARGKQAELYASYGCSYTRTTGIWQTVWLENRPKEYIDSVKYYPDLDNASVTIQGTVHGTGRLTAVALFDGHEVGRAAVDICQDTFSLTMPLSEVHAWELGCGRLYDLQLCFGEDEISSYFGLRSIRFDGMKFMLNGKSVFQRLILDQGFYPDGVCTAPTEEALIHDIELSMAAGFNGARLHQKVFEPRFLYHCDRLGYMVWGEYGSWGLRIADPRSALYFLPEWLEIIERDFNHPAIVCWCPFNETWGYFGNKDDCNVLKTAYLTTKAVDKTRPCVDTSGNFHSVTDIFDVHDYEQDPAVLGENYKKLPTEGVFTDRHHEHQTYRGEPVMISEYGGIGWNLSDNAWGYGKVPESLEAFYERYKGMADVLLDNPAISGFCYTQLTDVEQEKNGLYTYNREPKFDIERLKAALSRPAAIEL